MNVVIYIVAILGSLAIMYGTYYLIRSYALVYVCLCSIGAGVVAANLIITKDLSILLSVIAIILCGLIACVIAIPAMLITDIESLKNEIEESTHANGLLGELAASKPNDSI